MMASVSQQPVFVDLQDTPMFKQTVDDLQASAKKLKDRCAGLLSGAKKYRDGLAAMTEAQQSFAASLAEFGGGSDEDSLLLGELAGQGGLQDRAACGQGSLLCDWAADFGTGQLV
eukprot:GHRQ01015417.1.p2 GENE.GHRQ01015417.1~~GHRQ01015417.1.p2  ORF type:complete len:115 (+),score=39.11 GHRQ01015417.1:415-759(+)